MQRRHMQRRALTVLDLVALSLATIGAINWGLSGAANLNVVRRLFGRGSLLERAVYVVVGLAGLDLAWLTARYIMGGYYTPQPQYETRGTAERLGEEAGRLGERIERRAHELGQTLEQGAERFQRGVQEEQPYR